MQEISADSARIGAATEEYQGRGWLAEGSQGARLGGGAFQHRPLPGKGFVGPCLHSIMGAVG